MEPCADENNAGKPQYMPSVLTGTDKCPVANPAAAEVPLPMENGSLNPQSPATLSRQAANFRHRGKPSEYDQVRELWTRVMSDSEKNNTMKNTAFLLGTAPDKGVIKAFLVQCHAISPDFAQGIMNRLPNQEKLGFSIADIQKLSPTAHLVNVDPHHSVGMKEATSFMGMKKEQCPYVFKK